MNILGISGSPRAPGESNTNYMLKTVLEATGQDFEIIYLKDLQIGDCTACGGCYKTYNCTVKDDMQELYTKLKEADKLILGSPTYFDNVTGLMKHFIDRCLPFYGSGELKGTKAALVAVGNFKKGEIYRKEPDVPMDEDTIKRLSEKSVSSCIAALEKFCNHLRLDIIGKIIAIDSNPQAVEDKLVELGKKLVQK